MQFKSILFFFILSAFLFTGCGEKNNENNKNVTTSKINNNTFTLTTTNNENINIVLDNERIIVQEYANKIVLLNFFATWCPPCRAEIPVLNKIQEKYKNDFIVISVLLEEGKSNIDLQNFINEHKVDYLITNGNGNFQLQKALGGIKSIPTMMLIDKNSNLFQKYVGMVPSEMMDIDIKKVLQK